MEIVAKPLFPLTSGRLQAAVYPRLFGGVYDACTVLAGTRVMNRWLGEGGGVRIGGGNR